MFNEYIQQTEARLKKLFAVESPCQSMNHNSSISAKVDDFAHQLLQLEELRNNLDIAATVFLCLDSLKESRLFCMNYHTSQ